MAPRKPKTTEQTSEAVPQEVAETVSEKKPVPQKATETVSEKSLIKVQNLTRYPKVNPRNGAVFQPDSVVQDVVRDSWVEVQIKAGILKEIK